MQSGTGGNFHTFVRSMVLNRKTDANSLELQHLLKILKKLLQSGKSLLVINNNCGLRGQFLLQKSLHL